MICHSIWYDLLRDVWNFKYCIGRYICCNIQYCVRERYVAIYRIFGPIYVALLRIVFGDICGNIHYCLVRDIFQYKIFSWEKFVLIYIIVWGVIFTLFNIMCGEMCGSIRYCIGTYKCGNIQYCVMERYVAIFRIIGPIYVTLLHIVAIVNVLWG